MASKKYTFIDLFAGCGGLSEGFYREGFKALAHVEINHFACETLRTRMKHYGYKDIDKEVIEHDITADDIIEKIDNAVNGRDVDMIIGGPPCQAYSTAGRVRDKVGMATDARNYLFESYVKILEHYRPKLFVFENVTGILSAKANGKAIFPQVIKALGKEYKVIGDPETILFNTANYGVPQIRKRIIIMGVRKDIDGIEAKELYQNIIKTHYDPDMPEKERGKLKKHFYVEECKIGSDPTEILEEAKAITPVPAGIEKQKTGVLMVMMENFADKCVKFLPYGKIAIGIKYSKDSMAIIEHLSEIGYILFHTRKDEGQHLFAINGDITVVDTEELGSDVYKNVGTTEMYAVVPFQTIELDASNLHSSKKSFTPKTRYDAQFEELNNLQ